MADSAPAITCPRCQKKFKGKPELYGKRIRCPGCHKPFVVPSPEAKIDEAADNVLEEDIAGLAVLRSGFPLWLIFFFVVRTGRRMLLMLCRTAVVRSRLRHDGGRWGEARRPSLSLAGAPVGAASPTGGRARTPRRVRSATPWMNHAP